MTVLNTNVPAVLAMLLLLVWLLTPLRRNRP